MDVNIIAENKVELKPYQEILFTYEVIWKPSNVPFEKRFDKYLDPAFFQHRVCLFFNTFFMHFLDSLVFYIQFVHDGHFFGGLSLDDFVKNIE